MMKRAWLSSFMLVGVALVGMSCRKSEVAKRVETADTVAVVAGEQITADMLREELRRQFRHARVDLTSTQKAAALESLIQARALYAKAKATGFDRTPEMEARIRNLVATQYKEAHFPAAKAAVRDQEIEQSYRDNQARFATPAAAHAAVILIESPSNATPEKQAENRAHAEAVLAEAKAATNAQDFADVVRRHSADQATRYKGGDVGWLSGTNAADSKLVEALSKLKNPGDFAPLIASPHGLVVAKLLERREAGCKPLSEVKEAIRYELARLKMRQVETDFAASIKQGLDIQINQQLLEALTLPPEKHEAPKTPERQTAQLR